LTQREGELLQEKAEVRKLAALFKQVNGYRQFQVFAGDWLFLIKVTLV
jgi:hypothetical protein